METTDSIAVIYQFDDVLFFNRNIVLVFMLLIMILVLIVIGEYIARCAGMLRISCLEIRIKFAS